MVKNLPAHVGDEGDPGSGRYPGQGNGNPLQYSCLEKSHGQRSLEGYSPWDHKESDTTEQLTLSLLTAFLHSLDLINMSNKCQMSIYLKIFIRSFFFFSELSCHRASLIAQLVKNPPPMWETWVLSLGWEDPLGKGTHSQSTGSQRVGHD